LHYLHKEHSYRSDKLFQDQSISTKAIRQHQSDPEINILFRKIGSGIPLVLIGDIEKVNEIKSIDP
jgi:hypothetical protein